MTQTPTQSQTPLSLAQAPAPQVDLDRKRAMALAWKAYRGEFQDPLKVTRGQPNDNVKSNRCAPIVDKGVSFLFGKVLKIEASDEAQDDTDEEESQEPPIPGQPAKKKPPKPTPIQDYLDGLWGDDDDKMTLLSESGINGGVCGHTFIKLIPPQGQMQYPRLVVLDPELIRPVTDPDDCKLILAFVIEYPTSGDMQKRQIISRIDPDGMAGIAGEYDLDDTWSINTYIRRTSNAVQQSNPWMLVKSEDWQYPFSPIFQCQNLPNPNETWGKPDLTPDIIDMNRVLNFIQSNTSRILKWHAHPKTWGKGFRASQLSVAVDDTIIIESETGELQNLEMHSDLSSSLNFAATLRADMDEQSRVPAVALGREDALPKGNISGVALQLLFQPLMEKTTTKQRLYGKMIREISRAALVVAGMISLQQYENYPIEAHWQNLLPVDDLAAAQTSQILLGIGVSEATVLQELGYDADAEAVKSAKESARKLTNFAQGQGMPPPLPNQQQPAPNAAQAPQQDAQQAQAVGMGNN